MIHITAKRACRYKEKLDMVFKRAGQVQEWMGEVSEDEFLEEDKTKLAVYKAFQEAVEASLDLVAMMCKDLGITSQDDYSNLERLAALSASSREVLIEANGLRKIVVFGEEVEGWLERSLPNG